MTREGKARLKKFLIVLAVAVAARVIAVFIVPIDMQRYVSLGIMLLAIGTFFAWDFLSEKNKDK